VQGGSVAPPAKHTAGVAGANASAGQLPFTGFPAWILCIVGAVLFLAGLGVRRFAD
jgi:hypothetical protein